MRYCELEKKTAAALDRPPLSRTVVIEACGRFAELLHGGAYDGKIREHGMEKLLTREMVFQAASFLSGDVLRKRVETELSGLQNQFLMPLGVLMHVTAGNMTGIGAYSVLEGLLAGNINVLKLSSEDDGLSLFLLQELIRIEPALSDYIYTFRIPSGDRERLLKLLTLSDGVCTWGGDEAIRGIRSLAPAGTKLIEWGHRISFAYVTRACMEDQERLQAIADHMIRTNQLLCSSCQGIYVEAEGREKEEFCRRFLTLLNHSYEKYGNKEAGFRGSNTIRIYRKELEAAMTGDRIFRGNGVSVILSEEAGLQLSLMYGNCWVKPVNREKLVNILRKDRGKLQTTCLVCLEEEEQEMVRLLARAGVNRILTGRMPDLGEFFESHDGEYPLVRYSRIIASDSPLNRLSDE